MLSSPIIPCDENGHYLQPDTPPPDHQPLDATPDNPFHPFQDRLAFEFADYHFSQQESSELSINGALQLWAAQSAKNGHDDVPWKSAAENRRQLFHACLAYIYEPLKSAMTSPKVVRCPDGHFRRSIFSIGPYIADYPEQVWLTAIVSDWCPT